MHSNTFQIGKRVCSNLRLNNHIFVPAVINRPDMPKKCYLPPMSCLYLSYFPVRFHDEWNSRQNTRSVLYKHTTRNFVHCSAMCAPNNIQTSQLSNRPNNHDTADKRNSEDKIKEKILFNSVLEAQKISWLKAKIIEEKQARLRKNKLLRRSISDDTPIALKYIIDMDDNTVQEESLAENTMTPHETIVHLPFAIHSSKMDHSNNHDDILDEHHDSPSKLESESFSNEPQITTSQSKTSRRGENKIGLPVRPKQNWMTDYEFYADTEEEIINEEDCDIEQWKVNYGTPDSSIPVSRVPCGGCGALLHCQDSVIPGYLPSELFKRRNDAELRAMKCQRCHFLHHYNTALAVSVSPDEYPRILSEMKTKRALAIIMIDLMDFPCSIWPNILDIIGTKRPVVVVGNKVDLLPQDSPGFLDRVKDVLVQTLDETGLSAANIKHVALISAKTGYGVDNLITQLHNAWHYKGDVYLIGCTNVGKSTLFNALLQSDFCKVKAVDLVQRATTSQWPGTTLNLLKFPILRPEGWRMYLRTKRLISERNLLREEERLRQHQARKKRTDATLIGHIGRTFVPPNAEVSDPFSVNATGRTSSLLVGLNPKDKDFVEGRWCYDTPGTVQPAQVINLLTTEELMLTLPKKLLHPRSFCLLPGRSLFIAGLARLDYLAGSKPARFTVLASAGLPVTVCHTEDADELYSALLGTEMLAVPCGGRERLLRWPGLEPHPDPLRLVGEDWKSSCADVVLSSAGWVAVTPGAGMDVELRAWTSGGRGIFVRPSLLPHSVNLRGGRLRGSPAYKKGSGIYVR